MCNHFYHLPCLPILVEVNIYITLSNKNILFSISISRTGLVVFSEKATQKGLDMNTKYSSITDTLKKKKALVTKIDQYQIITLEHDTNYDDTALTIKRAYRQNYLQRIFFDFCLFQMSDKRTIPYNIA
jgi:hypothetical protein